MTSRQKQNTGTSEVREGLEFDVAQLSEYLTSHVEGFAGPLEVRQFRGGQSNPTYMLQAASGCIVNISSQSARHGSRGLSPAYNASKAGVLGLSEDR